MSKRVCILMLHWSKSNTLQLSKNAVNELTEQEGICYSAQAKYSYCDIIQSLLLFKLPKDNEEGQGDNLVMH